MTGLHFIWLDWAIVAIVIYNLGAGLFTGLLRSLINLAALATAYVMTPVAKGPVTQILQSLTEMPPYLAVPLGATLAWAGIYVIISSAGLIWAKIVDKTPLKILDRLGGVALGLFVSSLLILLPLTAVRSLPFLQKIPALKEALAQSQLLPLLNPALQVVETTVGPMILNYWVKHPEQQELEKSLPQNQATPHPQAGSHASSKPTTKPSTKPSAK